MNERSDPITNVMAREIARPKTREKHHNHDKKKTTRKPRHDATSSESSSQALSADSLAKLNLLNQKTAGNSSQQPKRARREKQRAVVEEKFVVEKGRKQHKRKKRRVVSGALLEEGEGRRLRGLRGGAVYEKYEKDDYGVSKSRKRLWILIISSIVLLIVVIAIAVVVSKKQSPGSAGGVAASDAGKPSNSNLGAISESDIPQAAKGTYLDPFSWYDTTDFNVTYTNETGGGLPVMGLNSEWDDSKSAHPNVPPISSPWGSYAENPARGVNLGGWLSLEPFITPSLFKYDSKLGVIDEWTLTSHLGPSGAKSTLEKHYATFVSEQTFIDIAEAGLDHVRIPFSYWAVTTYDGDPYVFRTSWRYLLRGIEWARKHGLRVNLDVHGLPGSQNGWNHSGRQGAIGWLNGPDGTMNGKRSIDIHDQLSQFFAQDRYRNIIAFYGLVNEPKMTVLKSSDVLSWTASAYQIVRQNGISAYLVFGDGFQGLTKWKGQLTDYNGLVLDAHQYVIFNRNQINFNHSAKVTYACTDWTEQATQSMNVATGFGPTLFAEWSQADTDCATHLNNVGVGTRWEGTYASGDPLTEVLSPNCPTQNSACSCAGANADPNSYSAQYKLFLQMFAEAQMTSFEHGWGWFYWTWKTETAAQWSYQRGLAAGILPAKAYSRDFNCTQAVPSFEGLPETY